MSGVVTLGETMGLLVAEETGPADRVERFRAGIGGAETNVAIGLARLGVRVTWIGRVGADAFGDRVRRELRAEGVETHVVVDAGAPTGLMVKTRPIPGAARVEYRRAGSAGSRLSPDDVPADLVRGAALLHVTGITPALSPTADAAVDRAVALAQEAGIPISFDVNHRTALWDAATSGARYRQLAAQATVVFAGLDEARLLAPGVADADLPAAIAATGPTQVVVKLGAEGCVARLDGESYVEAAVAIRPVDTVGAGDAFVAGYLAELLAGSAAFVRLRTAVRTGAFACLSPGDWEGFPRRADLGLLDEGDPVAR